MLLKYSCVNVERVGIFDHFYTESYYELQSRVFKISRDITYFNTLLLYIT